MKVSSPNPSWVKLGQGDLSFSRRAILSCLFKPASHPALLTQQTTMHVEDPFFKNLSCIFSSSGRLIPSNCVSKAIGESGPVKFSWSLEFPAQTSWYDGAASFCWQGFQEKDDSSLSHTPAQLVCCWCPLEGTLRRTRSGRYRAVTVFHYNEYHQRRASKRLQLWKCAKLKDLSPPVPHTVVHGIMNSVGMCYTTSSHDFLGNGCAFFFR